MTTPFIVNLRDHALWLLATALADGRLRGLLQYSSGDGLRIDPQEIEHLMDRVGPTNAPPIDGANRDSGPDSNLVTQLEVALAAGDPLARRWAQLIARIQPSNLEVSLLAALVMIHVDQTVARGFRFAWADFGRVGVPWGFLVRTLAPIGDKDGGLAQSVTASVLSPSVAVVFRLGLLELVGAAETPRAERSVCISDDVLAFLAGEPLPAVAEIRDHLASERPEVAARLQPMLGRSTGRRLAIAGPDGCGRRVVAGSLMGRQIGGGMVLEVDIGEAVATGTPRAILRRAMVRAHLVDGGLMISGLERLQSAEGDRRREWIEVVERELHRCTAPVAWILDAMPPHRLDVHPRDVVQIAYPTREERRAVWQSSLDVMAPDAGVLLQLSGRFLLTEGQIERVAEEALVTLDTSGALDPDAFVDDIARISRRAGALGLGRLATPELRRVGLGDVITDRETATLLQEIVSYARHRHQLASEWGFESSMPYGLGVTALFAGPPGTGKTMAASAVATALDLELYRVDLSQLVSKYIGETEKHMEELFDAAEAGEVMLLFDEADSLFGKRTEVKTSVDRYANLEVNYLLQRIERYSGVVALTTNFEAGIDEAFVRRIQFRVRFEAPDAEARMRLWQALIPAEVPLEDDLDLELIAEDFELSGGHIKEVVLRAAALALQAGSGLTQDLLIRSANAEYRKLGKLMLYEE